LKTRVHFQKVKVPVGIDQHLHGSGRVVSDVLGQRDGLFTHRLAGRGVNEHRGSLLDDFLVTTLDGAFTFREVDLKRIEMVQRGWFQFREKSKKTHGVSVLVSDDLDFNVTGLDDEFLDEKTVVAEG